MPREVHHQGQPTVNTLTQLNRDLEALQNQVNQLTLQVQEVSDRSAQLIADLTNQEVPIVVATPVRNTREVRPGDRVRIKNRISQITGREIEERDRLATVTRVNVGLRRIYITTDSGIETWRAPKNLDHSPRGFEDGGEQQGGQDVNNGGFFTSD